MKIKNILTVLLISISCAGCVKTESEMLAEIKTKFPNSEIRKIPTNGTYTHWLVKTPDNKIIYIGCGSMNELVEYSMF